MTLGQLLNYLNFVSTKENRGLTYTPDNFNVNLPVAVQELYSEEYDKFEKTKRISDVLSPYKVVMYYPDSPLFVDENGHAQKPADYQHHSTMEYRYLSEVWDGGVCNVGVRKRPIQFCTDEKFSFVKDSSIAPPEHKYPVVCERDTYFEFLPTDLEYVDFVYLKTPETPYFDYYINEDGDYVYMPPNTDHVLSGSEVGSSGEIAPDQVFSKSVELLMPPNSHIKLAQKLLRDIGINLRDQELLQYSMINKDEEKRPA